MLCKVKGHTKVECFEAYRYQGSSAEVLSYQTENEKRWGAETLALTNSTRHTMILSAIYGHFNKNTAIGFSAMMWTMPMYLLLKKFEETADEKGKPDTEIWKSKTDVFKNVSLKRERTHPANVRTVSLQVSSNSVRGYTIYRRTTWYRYRRCEENHRRRLRFPSCKPTDGSIVSVFERKYPWKKLRQAEENNEMEEFDRNIKALQEVMPMEIPAHLMDFTLSSSWIDPKLYEDFVKEQNSKCPFTAVRRYLVYERTIFLTTKRTSTMGVTSEMLSQNHYGTHPYRSRHSEQTLRFHHQKHYDGTAETITDKGRHRLVPPRLINPSRLQRDWAGRRYKATRKCRNVMERYL